MKLKRVGWKLRAAAGREISMTTQGNRGVLYYPPAFHEASHIVAAYFLGIRLKKVSLIHNKDYVGKVIHEKVAGV